MGHVRWWCVAARRIRKVERKDAAPGCSQCVAIWGALKSAAQAGGEGRGAMMAVILVVMGSLVDVRGTTRPDVGRGRGWRACEMRRAGVRQASSKVTARA